MTKYSAKVILHDIRQFAREIERGLVDFDVDFGKTSKNKLDFNLVTYYIIVQMNEVKA